MKNELLTSLSLSHGNPSWRFGLEQLLCWQVLKSILRNIHSLWDMNQRHKEDDQPRKHFAQFDVREGNKQSTQVAAVVVIHSYLLIVMVALEPAPTELTHRHRSPTNLLHRSKLMSSNFTSRFFIYVNFINLEAIFKIIGATNSNVPRKENPRNSPRHPPNSATKDSKG